MGTTRNEEDGEIGQAIEKLLVIETIHQLQDCMREERMGASEVELQLPVRLRGSARLKKLAQRALEGMEQERLQSNLTYSTQSYVSPILTLCTITKNMAAPDREEFRATIVTDVNGYIENNH
eukprot:9725482-Ditylum_brightwellii.AAC.2